MDAWVPGVGASCSGEQYHHTVVHLARHGVALCGLEIRGRDWWHTNDFHELHFARYEGHPIPIRWDSEVLCIKCAAKVKGEVLEGGLK